MNLSRLSGTALQYAFLGLAAFLSIFPFFWMVISATNTSIDIIGGKTTFGGAFLANVGKFFTEVDVPLIFWNSAKVAVLATVLTIAVSSLE